MADNDDIQEANRRIKEAIETGAEELSLEGLEGVTSLSDLDVDIAAATSVTILDLDGTQITDLTPIAGMTGITTLFLNNTQIADITPIAGITGITTLYLNNTQIADITAIAGMAGITELNLSNTHIADITPIAGMTGITELDLDNTQITDLTPVAGMTGITTLFLNNAQIADITPIAGMTGITTLFLNNTQITDLTPIASMTGITTLNLGDTPITDLTPIAGMTRIRRLTLRNTQITDLRPLQILTGLRDNPSILGLTFEGCKACDLDPRIAEIAKIEDNTERVETLFDYLKDWVPPGDGNTVDPDPILGVSVHNGKIDLDEINPDTLDALKANLHERLKKSANALSKAAGNQFPRLCDAARAIQTGVDKPFEDIDLISLFLDGEILKDWMDTGREDDLDFPDEVKIPLSSTYRDITGLTLGDPQIDILAERLDRAKSKPPAPDEVATHRALGEAVQGDPESMGPDIRQVEDKIDQLSDQVALAARKPMHRNVLWTIATFAGASAVGVVTATTQGIAVEALTLEIKNFVALNWPVIAATAETFGIRFANWFAISCAQVPELADHAKTMLQKRIIQTRHKVKTDEDSTDN